MKQTVIQIIPEGKVRDYIDGTIKKENPEEYVRLTVEKRSDIGTIGKIQIVPRQWSHWAVSQNIIKVITTSNKIAGYLYLYLQTEYAQFLIKRETYGSVVDMIDDKNVTYIPIPLLQDEATQQRINELVLQANELRYQAYLKEQEAINKMSELLTK